MSAWVDLARRLYHVQGGRTRGTTTHASTVTILDKVQPPLLYLESLHGESHRPKVGRWKRSDTPASQLGLYLKAWMTAPIV